MSFNDAMHFLQRNKLLLAKQFWWKISKMNFNWKLWKTQINFFSKTKKEIMKKDMWHYNKEITSHPYIIISERKALVHSTSHYCIIEWKNMLPHEIIYFLLSLLILAFIMFPSFSYKLYVCVCSEIMWEFMFSSSQAFVC